ncbi:MAG TPA: RsmB/NOP family class I SAM-dependent RNA methyltransferase [Flavobacteriales bacterium]|nr:RsmB/NOP family class I SAM-dependent RNA methyltransferase [Flavobacteriales bacterium]HRE97163.1 RsmB/NOP family class I SAM-dependent RNA methyltransferase [Flavobacteriales bacterium]HRJ35018.1 RsmB/NOP family class I SAM-dependent RNA methyltransferase [Flavobacteriales bacterium]HRJ37303.1 RsmB/NOP family class I SAM-dependent RNA methyltransferase [Flavobacteriales bacterium]
MNHERPPHFPLIDAVCTALAEIFEQRYYADKVIERTMKLNPKMGSRDRAFLAETTYDVVRWWRLLHYCAATNEQTDRPSLLRVLSAYFFLFHDKKYAWKENSGMDFSSVRQKHTEALAVRALRYSIPDWMDEMGERELGLQWEKELVALNEEAPVDVRSNRLKTNPDALSMFLQEDGIETERVEHAPDALRLTERRNIFRNKWFLEGYFEVQDAGSQQIAAYLEVKPGMRVIDACAGAGGKALHLAALMENKGRLIAMDVEERKLQELKKRSARAGVSIIEPKIIDSTKVIKRQEASADRLLLDVPCSGLGTLRRNPDAKWKLSPEFLEKVKKLQKEILFSYAKMLKPGGKMVYATCSIFPSENHEQVKAFLAENPSFKLVHEQKLSPALTGTDGFYMALIRKI